MGISLNTRLLNKVSSIGQGDTASTVLLELLDQNNLTIPYLDGLNASIRLINKDGEVAHEITMFVFDSRIEFKIDEILPVGSYGIEIVIAYDGATYVFPSSNRYRLRINKTTVV